MKRIPAQAGLIQVKPPAGTVALVAATPHVRTTLPEAPQYPSTAISYFVPAAQLKETLLVRKPP